MFVDWLEAYPEMAEAEPAVNPVDDEEIVEVPYVKNRSKRIARRKAMIKEKAYNVKQFPSRELYRSWLYVKFDQKSQAYYRRKETLSRKAEKAVRRATRLYQSDIWCYKFARDRFGKINSRARKSERHDPRYIEEMQEYVDEICIRAEEDSAWREFRFEQDMAEQAIIIKAERALEQYELELMAEAES